MEDDGLEIAKRFFDLPYLRGEIERDQRRLEELRRAAEGSGVSITGMPAGRQIADRVGKNAVLMADLEVQLGRNVRRCMRELTRMTRFINAVEDSLMRHILFYRYVKGYTYPQVAASIGGVHTADTIRKMHDRFFAGCKKGAGRN